MHPLPPARDRRRTNWPLETAVRGRRGVTLVELLVVVAIIVMVSAILVPMVGKAMQHREIREAARMLNTYLAAAQAQAVAENRPVGVWLERAGNGPDTCYRIYRAEVPPPYSGDIVGARAAIVQNGGSPWTATATLTAAGSLTRLVQVGDTIAFGFKGHHYPITAVSNGNQVTFTRPATAPMAVAPRSGPEGVSYQIFRKPRKTTFRSIELPIPAAIDITQSGLGIDPTGPLYQLPAAAAFAQAPIIITFAPNGSVEYIYYGATQPARPLAPIHLLVGKSNQAGAVNTADPNALWVSIGHSSGSITTAQNGGPNAATLPTARTFAQQAQYIGGK